MTTRIDDGGPAYPVADWDYQTFEPKNIEEARRLLSGMSLRDAFAMRAMAAMIASPGYCADGWPKDVIIAKQSYEMADVMLRVRSRGEPDVT